MCISTHFIQTRELEENRSCRLARPDETRDARENGTMGVVSRAYIGLKTDGLKQQQDLTDEQTAY